MSAFPKLLSLRLQQLSIREILLVYLSLLSMAVFFWLADTKSSQQELIQGKSYRQQSEIGIDKADAEKGIKSVGTERRNKSPAASVVNQNRSIVSEGSVKSLDEQIMEIIEMQKKIAIDNGVSSTSSMVSIKYQLLHSMNDVVLAYTDVKKYQQVRAYTVNVSISGSDNYLQKIIESLNNVTDTAVVNRIEYSRSTSSLLSFELQVYAR